MSIFTTKLKAVDITAAQANFPKSDIRQAIQVAVSKGMPMKNANRKEAELSYSQIARACLAYFYTTQNHGARHAPEQRLRRDYPSLIREIRYSAKTIAENADAIAAMAYVDPDRPDLGMIDALEAMGRALLLGLPPHALDSEALREWLTVAPVAGPVYFKPARQPLGVLAHVHDAAEKVEQEIRTTFASAGSPGNRSDPDLHDFIVEVVRSYQNILLLDRLSASPSGPKPGLEGSPVGRFVSALFDLMETDRPELPAIPTGLRPSPSLLRKIVDDMQRGRR